MALIGAYDDEPRGQNPNCRPGVQRYLAFLETQVAGEPGQPRAIREEFQPVQATELIDGPPPAAPELEKPKRKRRTVKPEPPLDRDAVNLARFARKLKGQGT